MFKKVTLALAFILLAGCNHDSPDEVKRRDKTVVPGVSDATKHSLIDSENRTYKTSKAEMKKTHDQIRHDMEYDLRHHTWHDQYPIILGPTTIVPDPVVIYTPPETGPPVVTTPDPVVTTPPIFAPITGNRRAVIVGINKYPGAALNGCVNDAKDIQAFSKANYGFTDSEIVFLTDEKATTANILQALMWLCQDTKAGDLRLFWYSGHGAEWAGSDVANQPDHQNQVICPVDFGWDEQHMIMDVQMHRIFATMPNGVVFNWGSDSCHSGDLTKAIPKPGILYKRWPVAPPAAVLQNLAAVKGKRGLPHRGIVAGELEVGFISGCTYDELSADTQDAQGRPCGAMTHYFLETMKTSAMKPITTVAAAMSQVMDQYQYGQHPQPEGSRKGKGWLQP